MEALTKTLGRELDVDEVARRLYQFASDLRAPVVGALHVTCSDESERECIDAFQRSVAEYLLPSLKFGERSHFRIANLGGRYEWGAASIADQHYSTAEAEKDFKLLLVKVNAHVSVESGPDGPRFGHMLRYKEESVYCGALHALLAGAQLPFADDLHEALASEGKDRIALLLDEARVDPSHRNLLVAVTSARLQARRALLDIQDRRPDTPTLFVVLACVTLNKKRRDGEIVCGVYRADWRSAEPVIDYQGLGDDPAAMRVDFEGGRVRLDDDEMALPRSARDHRELVMSQWRELHESGTATQVDAASGAKGAPEAEAKLEELMEEAEQKKHHAPDYTKPLLKILLHTLGFLDPISAVILLFGEGLVDIHHWHRIHRLSRFGGSHDEARGILQGIADRIDAMNPDRARKVVDFLHGQLRRVRRGSGST